MFGNDFFDPFSQRTYRPVRTPRPTRRYGSPYHSTRENQYVEPFYQSYRPVGRKLYRDTNVKKSSRQIRKQKINNIAATIIQRWWRNQQNRLKWKNAKLIKRYMLEEIEEPNVNTGPTLPHDYPYVLCHVDEYNTLA